MQNIFDLLRVKLREASETMMPVIQTDKAIAIVDTVEEANDSSVCEWNPSDINDEWKPSCDSNSKYNVFGVAWFKYCPYCGRKIEIKENEKIKVTELDVIITGTKEKHYYQIKYKELGKEYYNIGYGSYDINNVFNWKEECFEVVNEFGE